MSEPIPSMKKEISRLRSEVRKLSETRKDINMFTGFPTGNTWTQGGMPWASGEGRKAVLTEWFWHDYKSQKNQSVDNQDVLIQTNFGNFLKPSGLIVVLKLS